MVPSKKYFLRVYFKKYLERYKDMYKNVYLHSYMLYSPILDNDPSKDITIRCIFKTDSKSKMKIKLIVCGFKYEKHFMISDSSYGKYADIEVNTMI